MMKEAEQNYQLAQLDDPLVWRNTNGVVFRWEDTTRQKASFHHPEAFCRNGDLIRGLVGKLVKQSHVAEAFAQELRRVLVHAGVYPNMDVPAFFMVVAKPEHVAEALLRMMDLWEEPGADRKATPGHINGLRPNEVFVFGSNRAGRHGKGAAVDALRWGAVYGQGEGLFGQTYALPTKDADVQVLPLSEIQKHVDKFLEVARSKPSLRFLVTKLGCGLAGYKPAQIAELFKKSDLPANVVLPPEFKPDIRHA